MKAPGGRKWAQTRVLFMHRFEHTWLLSARDQISRDGCLKTTNAMTPPPSPSPHMQRQLITLASRRCCMCDPVEAEPRWRQQAAVPAASLAPQRGRDAPTMWRTAAADHVTPCDAVWLAAARDLRAARHSARSISVVLTLSKLKLMWFLLGGGGNVARAPLGLGVLFPEETAGLKITALTEAEG